jgi:Zn-dependent protease
MSPWSIRILRLSGIRVELHVSFLLLFALVYGLTWHGSGAFAAAWAGLGILLIFSSVLLHELGHCLVAQRFGISISRIILLPIGGMAQFSRIPREPRTELLITVAGPAVNFFLAFIFLGMAGIPGNWQELLAASPGTNLIHLAAVANLIMGTFNLLPIFPMDGGRIFRALMAYRFSYLNATRAAVLTGKILAVTGVLVALYPFQNYLAAALFAFIYVGGDAEYRIVRRQELFSGLSVGDMMTSRFETITMGQTLGAAAEIFRQSSATELLVLNPEGRVVGTLPRTACRGHDGSSDWESKKVMAFTEPVTRMLQVHWPLEILGENLLLGTRGIFPVYEDERLVGIVDNRQIQVEDIRSIADKHRRENGRPS